MVERQDIQLIFNRNSMKLAVYPRRSNHDPNKFVFNELPLHFHLSRQIKMRPNQHLDLDPPRTRHINKRFQHNHLNRQTSQQSSQQPLMPQLVIKKLQPSDYPSPIRNERKGISFVVSSALSGSSNTTVISAYKTKKILLHSDNHLNKLRFRMISEKKVETQTPFQLYSLFLKLVSFTLGIDVWAAPQAKIYVGGGNNHMLLKSILRERSWATFTENKKEANLVWTQGLKRVSPVQNRNVRKKKQPSLRMSLKLKGSTLCKLSSQLFSESRDYSLVEVYNLWMKRTTVPISMANAVIHNHVEGHEELTDKKNLLTNLSIYYNKRGQTPWDFIPLTFHVKTCQDGQFLEFLQVSEVQKKWVWLIKPAQNSNRGNGITITDKPADVRLLLQSNQNQKKTFVIQRYIVPLLYKRRKFDIRTYLLVTFFSGKIRGFWYEQGYGRTSSRQFVMGSWNDTQIHLTNDAIQCRFEQYGKFQNCNKISYNQITKYLSSSGKSFESICTQMEALAVNAIQSSAHRLIFNKSVHSFQLLGLDYLIDKSFKPWLIEINTNPCLQLSGPLLSRLIPSMLQNAVRIAVDPLFVQEQKRWHAIQDSFVWNKFKLIYEKQ